MSVTRSDAFYTFVYNRTTVCLRGQLTLLILILILRYEVSDMTQVYDMEPPGTLDTKEREKRWGIFLLQQISRGIIFAK